MTVYIGGTPVSRAFIGSTEASVYLGSVLVHAPAVPMGMDKSGTMELPAADGNPYKVTGWVVRAGYPDTSIVNDELVMQGTGTATVTYRGDLSSNFGTRTFYLFVNDVQVDSVGDASEDTFTPFNFVNGDRVALYASATSTVGDVVQAGSTTTYVYVDLI